MPNTCGWMDVDVSKWMWMSQLLWMRMYISYVGMAQLSMVIS